MVGWGYPSSRKAPGWLARKAKRVGEGPLGFVLGGESGCVAVDSPLSSPEYWIKLLTHAWVRKKNKMKRINTFLLQKDSKEFMLTQVF